MALTRVDTGLQSFPDFNRNQQLANAQIYIGVPGLDPTVLANQYQAYVVQENGTQVAVAQPIRTSAGGVPTYLGSPVQVAVEESAYSLKVLNALGSQIYYIADSNALANYATNSSAVVYDPVGAGAISTDVEDYLNRRVDVFNYFSDAQKADVLAGTALVDVTAAIQTAVNENSVVYMPFGRYLVDGTINLPTGRTLYGDTLTGPYFRSQTTGLTTRLVKKATSSAGPIIKLEQCTALRGVVLDCEVANLANEGILQFPGDVINVYCNISHVHILGTRSQTVTGPNVCYGIKMQDNPTTATVSFFNQFSNITITNCDVAIFMASLCNANTFTNIQTRECHIHYELLGDSNGCIENSFSALGLFSISSTLSPDPVGFKLTRADNNVFGPYTTEMFGKQWEIDEATCSNNKFYGHSNEPVASYAAGQTDLNFARAVNVSNRSIMNLTDRTTGDRNLTGAGVSFKVFERVTGTLPQLNNNAGTITAGDLDNKVILRFPTRFTKANRTSFMAKLKVFMTSPFGSGIAVAESNFGYAVRNETGGAAEFKVFSFNTLGNEITGLYFLTGVTDNIPFGIALVLGNYGAFDATRVRFELEVSAVAYGTFAAAFNEYNTLSSTVTADVTANDVTDAISLLTVATTVV